MMPKQKAHRLDVPSPQLGAYSQASAGRAVGKVFGSHTRGKAALAMRAVKLLSNERAEWDEALARYREQLMCYRNYLVQCECSDQILVHVEADVRERYVPDSFKLRFLVRTLVLNVIQHQYECNRQNKSSHSSAENSLNSVSNIPAQERLVYFMRDILEYSTRDTSLLMGITDAQVDSLLSFARKRIGVTEGPSCVEIQIPGLLQMEVRRPQVS